MSEVRDQFEEHGYYVLEGVLSAEEIAECKAVVAGNTYNTWVTPACSKMTCPATSVAHSDRAAAGGS